MRTVPAISCVLLAWSMAAVAVEKETHWDFERDAAGWVTREKGCGIVAEPGNPGNRAYRIAATRAHHTRLTLRDGAKTPNFLVSLRAKVLEWTGEPPSVYVYGRSGKGGFRGLTISPQGRGRVFSYYGQNKPAASVGSVSAGVGDKPEWIHIAFACFNDYSFGKAWGAGSPEPSWQTEGVTAGLESGDVALGVWTSPRAPSKATVLFDDVRFVPLTAEMLKAWGIRMGPRPDLEVAAIPKTPGVFNVPRRLGLASKRAALAFDVETGEITNFVDIPTGQEFISRDVKRPLFRVALAKPYDGKRVELTCRDFRKVAARRTGTNSLALDFDGHPAYAVSARVTAVLGEDETIRLRIRIDNRSDWSVASVVFPQMPAPAALHGDGADDRLLIPWSSGAVIPRPGQRNTRRDAAYPGSAFAQFYALYTARAGAYVAAYDPDGHCKRLRLQCVPEKLVSLTFDHLFPQVPGQSATLPYDVVLRTFKGDWRDAAEIYKTWAMKQPWCAKRLTERDEVPQFLKDGAGVIITTVHNPVGRKRWLGDKLEKLPDLMDAYRKATGLRRMIFVAYGWENRGTWAGINYLPTIPSDDVWRRTCAELRTRGHRAAFMTSGFWWVVKRRRTGSGPAFDDTADFERRRGMCSQNADGSTWKTDWYERTKVFGSWRGLSVRLCHGSPKAGDTMKRIFLDIARLGVPLISFDQEIGGGQREPCYSKAHGHPPGRGQWMWTGFRDVCAEILKEGKPIEPELGLFLENVSELAIPYMSTYWSRQFGEIGVGASGGRGVGLFSYLYHEYVTAIGAACVQGQGQHGTRPHPGLRCRVLANNLTRGLIQGPFMHDVPLKGGDKWRRQVSQAYRSFCRPYKHFPEYLVLGKTRRPIHVECDDVELWFWRRDGKKGKPIKKGGPPLAREPLVVPAVTTGSFQAADGSIAAFIVNTTSEPREAVVILPAAKQATIYHADRTGEETLRAASADQGVPVSLEPFGIRVVVLR